VFVTLTGTLVAAIICGGLFCHERLAAPLADSFYFHFVILHILVKHELFTARIISLFVYLCKPLSTHVVDYFSVTSGQIPKMFRGRNTVEKYGGQLYPTAHSRILDK
jgi:hypothetical protein